MLDDLKKLLALSLQFFALAALASVVYGFIVERRLTPAYVFTANFLGGAVIIVIGILLMFMPAFVKFGKLVDHTTFGKRMFEERANQYERALRIMYLGIAIIVVAAVIQLALSLIIA